MATIDYLSYVPQSWLNQETTSNFGKLWTIFSEQLDELLVQVAYVYTLYLIDSMTGYNLNQIGTLVNRARISGETDADYRTGLRIAIAKNISGGSIPNILAVCNLFKTSEDDIVRLQETTTARFQLYTNILELITDGVDVLNDTKAAGIGMNVSYSESLFPFVFSGDTDGKGFGQSTESDGGEFSQSA
jgi:hypothetical protein